MSLTRENGKHTRLYSIWADMRTRCYNANCKAYKHYGGRGITVCEEWRNSFKAFHDWALSNGYNDNLTIDRINVNGNYEPLNCRWATIKEQANNKRYKAVHKERKKKEVIQWSNTELEKLKSCYDKGMSISEICGVLGKSKAAIRNKAYRLGITQNNSFTAKEKAFIIANYKSYNLQEIARVLNRPKTSVCRFARENALERTGKKKNPNTLKQGA